MSEDKGSWCPCNRWIFRPRASVLTVYSGRQPMALSKGGSGLGRRTAWRRIRRASLSVCACPNDCYRERALNINICFYWTSYNFPGFQIYFMRPTKFQSACTKLSVILRFISNCYINSMPEVRHNSLLSDYQIHKRNSLEIFIAVGLFTVVTILPVDT